MVIVQRGRSKRKVTGGRYKLATSKRKYETGNLPAMTKKGKQQVKILKTKGGNRRKKMTATTVANVLDPKTKKYTKSTIKTVEESAANRHFVRRNIIVKGTVILTEAGKAKVTSRPGQNGTVNAVLI